MGRVLRKKKRIRCQRLIAAILQGPLVSRKAPEGPHSGESYDKAILRARGPDDYRDGASSGTEIDVQMLLNILGEHDRLGQSSMCRLVVNAPGRTPRG